MDGNAASIDPPNGQVSYRRNGKLFSCEPVSTAILVLSPASGWSPPILSTLELLFFFRRLARVHKGGYLLTRSISVPKRQVAL